MVTRKIGPRGQVTLPSRLRQQLDLKVGDHIAIVRRGDDLVIHPVRKTLVDLRGNVPVAGPQDFDAIRQQTLSAHAQRLFDDPG
ncbi:MAG: AbrB/MazE/SpoVT family DNA-binding domain-containing protein [Candidatus Latescibacterota bacterium]|jgi:AbrB family looped-hinge helix DNA binding protein